MKHAARPQSAPQGDPQVFVTPLRCAVCGERIERRGSSGASFRHLVKRHRIEMKAGTEERTVCATCGRRIYRIHVWKPWRHER